MSKQPPVWMRSAEFGTLLGIRFVVFSMRLLGRRITRLFLRLIVLYYLCFYPRVRRASRSFLERILDAPPRFRDVYRHVLSFAQVSSDRVYWITGNHARFKVTESGREHLLDLARAKRGALFLTAHLGSAEALAASARPAGLRVSIAGYFANAERFNRILRKLSPDSGAHFIHLLPGELDSVLKLREVVDAGEVVVIAADRLGLNDRSLMVDFLDLEAALPAGPFLLASILRCPVYFVAALFQQPDRYDLYCQPLSDGLGASRAGRQAAIELLARRYANLLEEHCRASPNNWFNFYDFWNKNA